ncbi:phage head closure protein [Salaquimonas pukyongi]|uniref:phage head closure protein n=1 Tax=Salaquimonas pukyongi TaxID=2712698 RepID=UPI00096BAB8A|nr:phage head closure protein [Salaquimonas pukyongi]
MNGHAFLQAGSFSVRLTLQQRQETDDGAGGFASLWQNLDPVWARIIPVEGIVAHSAANLGHAITHWIYIRMNNSVRPGMRFVKGARIFDVDTVHDPDETGRYLVCKVVERS